MTSSPPCPHGYSYRPLCPVCGTGSAATLPQPAPSEETREWTGPAPASTPVGIEIPGYEVLGELGRGGMGVVFKARQVALDRVVALKMILAGELARPEERQRFRAEAEAVARLQHPIIVQLHEYGECGGRPYFSLEFVGGGSLAEHLDGTPLTATESAALVETLAGAMHYAHSMGVVHRDLKPANILLQQKSEIRSPKSEGSASDFRLRISDFDPKVSDFGLAKRLEGASGQTHSGAVLGTPSYMAPEQADGRSKDVGPATDVYALGAVLYECLTGRPPFRGASAAETMLQVTRDDPVPPRRLRPGLPADLETIALKCLAKESGRRYASALALADDLRRYRAGEPIAARRTGAVERLHKWVRRRPAVAALYAFAALTAAVLFAAGARHHAALRTAYGVAAYERDLARERTVRLTVASGTARYDRGDRLRALPWYAEALRLEQDDPARAATHRTRLAAALADCPRLRAVWAHAGPVRDLAISADGRRAATTTGADVLLWNVAEPDAPPYRFTAESVTRLSFGPDGRLLVLAAGRVALRDAAPGELGEIVLAHPQAVTDAAWSADGRRVATSCTDGMARVWDSAGRLLASVEHPRLTAVALNRDGSRLATGSRGGFPKVWDIADRRWAWSEPTVGDVRRLVLDRTGGRVLWAIDSTARLLDIANGTQRVLAHAEDITDLALSSDGRAAATASADDTARLWDAASGAPLTPALRHGSDVLRVAFSPDGRRVATCGDDNIARAWDVASGGALTPPLPHAGTVVRAVFGADGRTLLTASADGTAKLWELTGAGGTGVSKPPPLPAIHEATHGAQHVQVTDAGREAVLTAEGRPVGLLSHGSRINSVAFSPDGSRVVTASEDNTARVWDAATGTAVTPPLPLHGSGERAVFSPDGQAVLTVSRDGAAWVWDAATGQPIAPVPRRAAWVGRALAGAPDRWELPTDDRPVEVLVALAQWLSGQRVDATGGLVPLSIDELREAGVRVKASAKRR